MIFWCFPLNSITNQPLPTSTRNCTVLSSGVSRMYNDNNKNSKKERSLYYRACAKSHARRHEQFLCFALVPLLCHCTAMHCSIAGKAQTGGESARWSTPTSLYSRENGRLYLCGRPPETSMTTTERKSNGTREAPTTKGPARKGKGSQYNNGGAVLL